MLDPYHDGVSSPNRGLYISVCTLHAATSCKTYPAYARHGIKKANDIARTLRKPARFMIARRMMTASQNRPYTWVSAAVAARSPDTACHAVAARDHLSFSPAMRNASSAASPKTGTAALYRPMRGASRKRIPVGVMRVTGSSRTRRRNATATIPTVGDHSFLPMAYV